jgi:tetratricopeptide (TPR) repeat protein
MAIYAVIGLLALVGAWSFNVDNVYADMRFQQGQSYTESASAQLDQQIVGTSYYLDAIRMEPQQDFYYLSLGRSLMTIVALRAEASQGAALGTPPTDARVESLLRLDDPADVQEFVLQRQPLELMGYARAVLERARDINQLNKDHYANLGRMYNFWYQTLVDSQDPALLQQAIEWYRRGHEVAPQDVTILNEYASAVARTGDYEQAARLLDQSRRLDPRYTDTALRYGELMRLQERYAEAADGYLALLAQNPHALDSQIAAIASDMQAAPDQLRRLRDAYTAALASDPGDPALLAAVAVLSDRAGDLQQAAEAFGQVVQQQPDNLEARQNYTLVLSDLLQYEQAAQEAEALLAAAERQGRLAPEDRGGIEALIIFFRSQAGG